MGCCTGDREKLAAVKAEQKWAYINLDDFKSSSCWTFVAYGYLYFMLLISISVYCVDTFTAVNLLVFDRWAGQIQPEIPLRISRWIFAGCIILSFLFLFFRWARAIKVMRQAGVANCYLDPLAVRIESVRMGQGRGWKRFLVFAELTKSRKGADYVALFAHYSFEAWLRILLAEGPRQVVNAVTLYSVMKLNLIPVGEHSAEDGHTPIVQFFVNVGLLANKDVKQAVILFGMLFTLLIWVISLISLIVAIILYMVFLWHHIPTADGSLKKYCRRKIDTRLGRIVKTKVDKAIAKENAIRVRQQAKEGSDFKRQPTLPDVGSSGHDDFPGISRANTMGILPPEYSSMPPTSRSSAESFNGREPTLPDMDMNGGHRPGPPTRTGTHASAASWTSYDSNAPLMNEAGSMGYASSSRGQTPVSGWGSRPPPPSRIMTGMSGMSQPSQRAFSPTSGVRPNQGGRNTPGTYQMEPLGRSGTNMSSGPPSAGPRSASSEVRRTPSNQSNPYFPPMPSSLTQGPPYSSSDDDPSARRTTASSVNPYFRPIAESSGRSSPAPSYRTQMSSGPPPSRSFTPGSASSRSMTPAVQPTLPRLQTSDSNNSGYLAFSPDLMSSGTPTPPGPTNRPYRSYSRPGTVPPTDSYSGKQTPQSSQPGYAPLRLGTAPPADSYSGRPTPQSTYPPPRVGTAPPGGQRYDHVADIYDNY